MVCYVKWVAAKKSCSCGKYRLFEHLLLLLLLTITLITVAIIQDIHSQFPSLKRNDERWSAAPGGAWLPHAVPPWLPQGPVRHHAGVLAQGGDGAAHLRNPAVEAGGVLHHGPQGLPRGVLRQMRPLCPGPPELSWRARLRKWWLPSSKTSWGVLESGFARRRGFPVLLGRTLSACCSSVIAVVWLSAGLFSRLNGMMVWRMNS